jgi:hypothetical protein
VLCNSAHLPGITYGKEERSRQAMFDREIRSAVLIGISWLAAQVLRRLTGTLDSSPEVAAGEDCTLRKASLAQVNLGINGHARTQLIEVPLVRTELYPDGQPLYDLDVVARGILGRKQT